MAEITKGTDNNLKDSWFIDEEAHCIDSLDTYEDLFDMSTECSNISSLIDDTVNENAQGNTLALFNEQINQECDRAISELKRKYNKSSSEPTVEALSPRLEAIRISPDRSIGSKRRLFEEDSGILEDEASHSLVQVETTSSSNGAEKPSVDAACQEILLSRNKKAKLLTKFEDYFGVPYTELTRNFKSDKSTSENWVISAFAAASDVIEASKTLLQKHCEYIQCVCFDFSVLYLLQFKHAKNRETVVNLFCSLLNIQDFQMICDPPKCRSVAAALYFYKQGITQNVYKYGVTPLWVSKLTQVNHQLASQAEAFELSQMVQWAYDNHFIEESTIAYNYASIANEDANAAAFLKSNNQVRFVRDCSAMVKLYLRQEMRNMSMSEWIFKCCKECDKEGDWKDIANLLKFQNVNVLSFLTAMRLFFKEIPKRNCILIHGVPDSGKSYFCHSLVRFLKGKVVSFMNRNSNFWLQPMLECKIGYLDDATYPCWTYIDVNMRNALDGNCICIDAKHKAPQQHKLPPFLVTSNIDIHKDENFKYLHSRVTSFEFPNKLPLDNEGNPLIKLTDQTWKSFFLKLSKQLDLQEDENEPERPDRAFRCTTSPIDGNL